MDNKTLKVTMFGGFTLTYENQTIDDKSGRSKKLWMLIVYLLLNRDRVVPQDEIIDLLWPDENVNDPINTLKVLIHRTRQTLSQLGIDGKDLIINRNGTYSWHNKGIELVIDTDIFETFCKKAEQAQDNDEKLINLLAAIDIYKGAFLPKSANEVWVMPISAYFHGQYIKIVKDALYILNENKAYDEIIRICGNSIAIDPYDEELHINLITALSSCGRYQEALSHYETTTKMFYNQFGITPSGEFMAVYKQLVKMNNNVETDLIVIKNNLREIDEKRGAFFCEYEVFKEIYQLEARTQMRSGQVVFLSLFTITDSDENKPKQNILSSSMDKLKDTIQSTLRVCDVFTRFSVSQYLIMLPCGNFENGNMVTQRIIKKFYQNNPRSTIKINYTLQPLEPKSEITGLIS